MKHLSVFILGLSLSFFTSCTKEDASSDILKSGWKVTLYTEDGVNKAASFSDYIFEFKDNNILIASKGTDVMSGFWKETEDSGRKKMIIEFAIKSGSFDGISEDWTVSSKSESAIKLTNSNNISQIIDQNRLEFGK